MHVLFKHKLKNGLRGIAEDFGVTVEQARHCVADGREMGRWAEYIYENIRSAPRANNEGSSWDNLDNGDKVEVRTITDRISFAPSKSRGSSREVKPGDFERKLEEIDHFVAVHFRNQDGTLKENMSFIKITKEDIEEMMVTNDILCKDKTVCRSKFFRFFIQQRLRERERKKIARNKLNIQRGLSGYYV